MNYAVANLNFTGGFALRCAENKILKNNMYIVSFVCTLYFSLSGLREAVQSANEFGIRPNFAITGIRWKNTSGDDSIKIKLK